MYSPLIKLLSFTDPYLSNGTIELLEIRRDCNLVIAIE